jgi:hypothetical protein
VQDVLRLFEMGLVEHLAVESRDAVCEGCHHAFGDVFG